MDTLPRHSHVIILQYVSHGQIIAGIDTILALRRHYYGHAIYRFAAESITDNMLLRHRYFHHLRPQAITLSQPLSISPPVSH